MTTLDIILLVLLALAVAVAAYFFFTRRRAAAKAVAVYGDDLKRQIKQSEEEALRYKILYTDAASAAEMQTMETTIRKLIGENFANSVKAKEKSMLTPSKEY